MAGATAAMTADNRTAAPPAGAPEQVVRAIAAANRITRKPYKWGGGHGRWRDSGYDCSGTVSYVLHAAGLLKAARDSSGLMSYGARGKGELDHRLRPRRARLHGHRRPALRHVGSRRGRPALARSSRAAAAGFVKRHPAGL